MLVRTVTCKPVSIPVAIGVVVNLRCALLGEIQDIWNIPLMHKLDIQGKFVQYCRWNEIVLYKQECAACTVHTPDAFESYKGRAAFARLIPDT